MKYEYKELSPKAKKRAFFNILIFYRYILKDMLKNSYFDENGKRLGCYTTMDVLI